MGEYKVTARNEAGQASSTCTVNVIGKPSGSTLKEILNANASARISPTFNLVSYLLCFDEKKNPTQKYVSYIAVLNTTFSPKRDTCMHAHRNLVSFNLSLRQKLCPVDQDKRL